MPHPARSFSGSFDTPCSDSGRGDAAGRTCGDQAQGQPVGCRGCCRMCCLMRLFPSNVATARRKRGDVRSAGARGFRSGAIRVVRGRRVIPRRPPASASPVVPPQGFRPFEFPLFRFLPAGG